MEIKSSQKDGKGIGKFLGKYDIQDLKNIRIAIRRSNIPDTGSAEPLLRTLDDPYDLIVHRTGEGLKPIFERKDVVVNTIEVTEERTIVKSPDRCYDKEKSEKFYNKDDVTSTSRRRSSSERRDQSYQSEQRRKSRDISPYQSKVPEYKKDSYSRSSFSPQKYSSRRSKSKEKSPPYRHQYPSTSKDYQSNRNVPDKNLDRYKYYRERAEEKQRKESDRGRPKSPSYSRAASPRSKYHNRSRSPHRSPEGYRGPTKSYSDYREHSPPVKHKHEYRYRSKSPHRKSEGYPPRRSTSPRHRNHKSYSRRSRSPREYREKRSRTPDEYRKYKYENREKRSRSSSRERYKHENVKGRLLTKDHHLPHSTREVSYVVPYFGTEAYLITPPEARPPFIKPAPYPEYYRAPPPYVFFPPRPIYPPGPVYAPRPRHRLPIYNNRTIPSLNVTTTSEDTPGSSTNTSTTVGNSTVVTTQESKEREEKISKVPDTEPGTHSADDENK